MIRADMALRIDDAFIREWQPRYALTENDEKEYARVVDVVAQDLESMGTISKKTFLDIWSWKGAMRVIGRTTIHVEGRKTVGAAEDEYEARYAPAFRRAASAPPERKLAELLADSVKLPGVGAPTGSTLLHFMHPETMPIIDVRTVETLFAAGLISTELRELKAYEEYRRAINEIVQRCPGWSLRAIDRALFAYHKQELGKRRALEVTQPGGFVRQSHLYQILITETGELYGAPRVWSRVVYDAQSLVAVGCACVIRWISGPANDGGEPGKCWKVPKARPDRLPDLKKVGSAMLNCMLQHRQTSDH